MWKWIFGSGADFSFLYIVLFAVMTIGIIYGIDFTYKKVKRKLK